MTIRTVPALCLTGVLLAVCAPRALAQQTVNGTIGYFVPLSADARARGDVLAANLDFLEFEVPDFNSPAIGGEWLVGLGQFVEAGVGASFSRRTVPSVYADFVDSDGSEIDQDLRLQIVPVTFSARVLPFGQRSAIQPYFGAGVSVYRWEYEERGEFVDFGARRTIFRDEYTIAGRTAGAVILGGLRLAGDRAAAGVEIRRQMGRAALDNRFSSDTLDLGGWTVNMTLGVRF